MSRDASAASQRRSRSRRAADAPELELERDEGLLERGERVQHVAWGVMLAVVVAALAGLLGHGPASSARAGSDALSLRYHRFERYEQPTSFQLDIAAGATDPTLTVWISRRWAEHVRIDAWSPEPVEERALEDRVGFEFAHEPGLPFEAVAAFTPGRAGAIAGWLEVEGRGRISFRQFVWP